MYLLFFLTSSIVIFLTFLLFIIYKKLIIVFKLINKTYIYKIYIIKNKEILKYFSVILWLLFWIYLTFWWYDTKIKYSIIESNWELTEWILTKINNSNLFYEVRYTCWWKNFMNFYENVDPSIYRYHSQEKLIDYKNWDKVAIYCKWNNYFLKNNKEKNYWNFFIIYWLLIIFFYLILITRKFLI